MLEKIRYHRKGIALIVGLSLVAGLLALIFWGNPVVSFEDDNLEQLLKEAIETESESIHESDLRDLEELDASGLEISSLVGLEHCTQLITLNLEDNQISDLSPLAALSNLQTLNLRSNAVQDLTPLSSLMALESLDLRDNQVRDLAPLSELISLEYLNLRENRLEHIMPLSSLVQLEYLNLHSNPTIESVQPLAPLVQLETLILRNVPVGDEITALSGMTRLHRINLRNSDLRDTSVLADLMAEGALQDDPLRDIEADVNLLENDFGNHEQDPVGPIRPYWPNITQRQPLELPDVGSSLKPPNFSRSGGFFTEGFSLALSSADPKLTLRYTLDGSRPGPDSPVYSESIPIQDKSEVAPTLAKISTANNWVPPQGETFQGTVVRAAAFADDGQRSETISHTYFVDPAGWQRYSLPVLSLSVDPDALFDEDLGIYTQELAGERGLRWERPAHVTLHEPDGSLGFSQNIGVRIHGGWTRHLSQKSLRLYARPEYDDPGVFEHEVFPGAVRSGSGEPLDTFSTLILRNSGNDFGSTMLRDAFLQDLVAHQDSFETQNVRPAILFVNGEYWGIHNIRERYDESYFRHHFDLDEGDVAILTDNASLDSGSMHDRIEYLQLRQFLKEQDLSQQDIFEQVTEEVDVQSFIDYFTANIYFGNYDWPQNNIDFWRVRETALEADDPFRDGRWRWLLYDTDFGFGLYSEPGDDRAEEFRELYGPISGVQGHTLDWVMSPISYSNRYEWPNIFMHQLLANEGFRHRFINAMADGLNSQFKPDRVSEVLDARRDVIAPEIEEHIRRWNNLPSQEAWHKNLQAMHDFGRGRPQVIYEQYTEAFDLAGTATLRIEHHPGEGSVKVNRLLIDDSTPGISDAASWQGRYFQKVPIEVTALPAEGYEFAGWWDHESEAASIEITLTQDLVLIPYFRPLAAE